MGTNINMTTASVMGGGKKYVAQTWSYTASS